MAGRVDIKHMGFVMIGSSSWGGWGGEATSDDCVYPGDLGETQDAFDKMLSHDFPLTH